VSPQRVRQLLSSGDLEGTHDPITETWKIPQHAVHTRLETRRPREPREGAIEAREWTERALTLERELGRIQGRLELTEQAESTLAGCPVPAPLEKSSTQGGLGKDTGCSHEGSTHPISSRQPGVGLGGQAHGAVRQRDDRVPPRTSENSPSTHSGE
jgi:hypothetical protein